MLGKFDTLFRLNPNQFVPKEIGVSYFEKLAQADQPLILHPGASSEWRKLDLPNLHRSGIKFWDILALKYQTPSTLEIEGNDIIDAIGCRTGSGRIVEAVMLRDDNWTQEQPVNAQYQLRTWPDGRSEEKPIIIASLPFTSTKDKYLASRQILEAEMQRIQTTFSSPESNREIGNQALKESASTLNQQLRRIKTQGEKWDRDPFKLRFIYT